MIEKIVGIFIPPACREEVLGDLREKNDGAQLFLYDALRTIPFVIVSRIRRTTDSVVLPSLQAIFTSALETTPFVGGIDVKTCHECFGR